MRLGELTDRLDARFQPAAFDEHDGWDMVFGPGERAALLQRAAPNFAATFNGLMRAPVMPQLPSITRVYLLVFPERDLLDRVAEMERRRGAPGAVVVTRHVADMEMAGRGFLPIAVAQLDALRAAGVAAFVL